MTAEKTIAPTAQQIADYLYASGMRCNCDLDNWEPTARTGHSEVCRIHEAATARPYDMPSDLVEKASAWLERTA